MSKIIEIEDALKRINGDNFQEFCNHYLFYKLNPNSIDPIGSVIGKEKSRKGIPDSYFTTKDGELIFAEYTTKEKLEKGNSFLDKLKSDIENCFDHSKTSLKPDEINKVILCFTSRINPKERLELQNLCDKFNHKCSLELIGIRDLSYTVLDYPILGDYLGIKLSTEQIQKPSDFIADHEKSKLSTPLSNTFLGRKNEMENGLIKLEKHNVLLIHGAPGTGKSKYAIELSKKYTQSQNDVTFLCIGNKGRPIWEDLKTFIRKDKKYILLVDDANRLAKNYQWILSLLNDNLDGNLKIIVTVRDYALVQIKEISDGFNYESIEINVFTDDEIKEIIKSKDFDIQEPADIDRILKIARGNARLAIMSAKVASESKNILTLNDASQIYDEYFNPILNEVQILNDSITLKALSVISFFGKIDKDNRELCNNIFLNLEIEENSFWEICYSLNENELVDLFEQQVVKISDQIFSTYIFYKAVIDLEIISFNFFLDNYLEYESRISDTIIPVLNTFNYKKIEEKLKPIILAKWNNISSLNDYEKSLKYLDLFWFYLSSQVLVFFKRHIDSQQEPDIRNYRYTYELNEFSYGAGKDIEMLSRFKNLHPEEFKDALELLSYYGIKIPDKLPAIIYTLKEKFNFTRLGYRHGDYIQHIVLDFLIDKAENSKDKLIFENILLELIPNYLKIEYTEHEGNGRQITIYTYQLWLSESIKKFRKKCFDYLDKKAIGNKPLVLKTINSFNIFDYKKSKEIYEYDKVYIFSLIDKYFNPEEFEDCFVFHSLTENLELIEFDYPKGLKSKFNNNLYRLAEILKSDRKRRRKISWQEEEKLHEKELIEYCNEFNITDYIKLFDNVGLILKNTHASHIEYQYYNALNIIIGDIAKKDYKLFIKLIDECVSRFDYKINYSYIFYSYCKYNPKFYNELFLSIKKFRTAIKLEYHQVLLTEQINSEQVGVFYKDFIRTIKSIENQYFFRDLTFISKYAKNVSEINIYIEILDIILAKIEKNDVKISVGARFIERCLSFSDFPFDKITKVYLYAHKFEENFDYKKELLKKLVEKENHVLFELLSFNSPERLSYHDLEHENFDFIWELNNYEEIVKSLIDYFLKNNPYLFWERAINAFFPQSNDKYGNKPTIFLENMISNYSDNEKYMEVCFNIICYAHPDKRDHFLHLFLTKNTNFKLFENLELVKRGGVYTGSRIPYFENDKLSWQRVLSVIDKMPNRLDFIEHKGYVNQQIEYCSLNIKREMKREFLDDFR
ncbi:MAG: hypothetical protein K8S18_14555 [Desulfobacula sp.]|nr:hypothetical protein [Desulfobacula sp.]